MMNKESGIANKAAEEGELREFKRYDINSKGLPFEDPDGVWVAYEDVAADRASRQVANKAEVDTIDTDEFRDLLAAFKYCKFGFDYNEKVQNLIAYIARLIATPPATTGASTAPATDRMALIGARVTDMARAAGWSESEDEGAFEYFQRITYELGQSDKVGASTVLTDERIDQLWKLSTVKSLDQAKPVHKVFARAIEREVAAQAGQVMSVPSNVASVPSAVAVPVISSYDLEKVKAAKTKFVDALIYSGVQYRTCGSISATLNRIIDESEAAAAPSPAKESK